MINIIKNTAQHVIFEKDSRNETWFNNNCSNENILKLCNRVGDEIEKVRFEDGRYIGSLLHVYFYDTQSVINQK